MRVAVVTPRFLPEGVVGGAETLLRDLARLCAEGRHQVDLLTTCAADHVTWDNVFTPGEETVEGLRVHRFRVNAGRNPRRFHQLQDHISTGRDLTAAEEQEWAANSVCSSDVLDWLRTEGEKLDVILGGPYLFGMILESLTLFPEKSWLVPCLHDEPFARLGVIRKLFTAVRGCLFNSEPEQALAERLYGRKHTRSAVVGMSMPDRTAPPDAFAKRHGITEPYVLYCGRQERGKNTPLLLDYMENYTRRREGVRLVLTGSGDVMIPEGLRPRLRNCGVVSEQEKLEAMAGAAVFVQPSTNESFGIVLLEAWLAGVPALVHDTCEVLRWQCRRAGAGLWFRDYAEFETMLDRLLADRELNRRLGQQGREYVLRTYAADAVAARLFDALENKTK